MKSFNEIYEKVYKECSEPLEMLRKKARNKFIGSVLIFIIIGAILNKITKANIFIVIAILISSLYMLFFKSREQYNVSFSKSRKQYNVVFKEKVIKSFIKEYSENLEFHPLRGIPQQTYSKARFEYYDNYYSEDLITGTLEGGHTINMAEVVTESETTDSDGDTTRSAIFYGLFAEVELSKVLNADIRIRKNGISLFSNEKDKMEMDSGEFEKKFDVYSTDKIIAMQLLTADIMQMLIDFKEKNKVTPEMTIEGNRLYIRFLTGEVFEANLVKKALDYSTLNKYYNIINFTLDLTEKFLKNINETEV